MMVYTCKKSGNQYKQVGFWEEPYVDRLGTYTVRVLEDLNTGNQVGVAHNIVLREYTTQEM